MNVGCSIAKDIIYTHNGNKVKSHEMSKSLVNKDGDEGKVVSEGWLLSCS
jgi:hypothetical protein